MPVDFHIVGKQTFKLLNIERGTVSYLILTFDDFHFVETKIAIYSAIIDLTLNSKTHTEGKKEINFKENNLDTVELYKGFNKNINSQITKDDIETLYKSSISILVSTYENIKAKFYEIKSASYSYLKQENSELNDLVIFYYNVEY